MRRWRRFDRGNFDLTGPRLSHESKCVSQALEMEGRSLWLWHPCEGLRLLGVKCDTSLGRCWFSAATAQQTSSQGVPRGVWARGVGSATHRPENGGLMLFIHKAIIWQNANHVPSSNSPPCPPLWLSLYLYFKHAFCQSRRRHMRLFQFCLNHFVLANAPPPTHPTGPNAPDNINLTFHLWSFDLILFSINSRWFLT